MDPLHAVVAEPSAERSLAGMPLLFRDPDRRIAEWRAQVDALLQAIEFDLHDAQVQAGDGRLLPSTRGRLRAYADAQADNLERLRALCAPLSARENALPAPGQPNSLLANYTNLLRDWAWPTDENERHLDQIRNVLPAGESWRRVLVLGAGGCRLAYDLARWLRPELLVATEINPLLFLVASRVLTGERVSLWEFSPLPVALDRCHRLCELSAAEVVPGIRLVFQDFLEPAFVDGAFDLVVTPWFIDIIPAPMAAIVSRVNQLLRPGGVWINFGPLMVQTPNRAALLTRDEVLELAGKHGFAVEKDATAEVPSLRSDFAPVDRRVVVSTWTARKVDACPVVPVVENEVLPPFLIDHGRPISFGVDVGPVIATHDLVALVLRCAQKGMSVDTIVHEVRGRLPAGDEQIRALVVKTLRGLYLGRRGNSMLDGQAGR